MQVSISAVTAVDACNKYISCPHCVTSTLHRDEQRALERTCKRVISGSFEEHNFFHLLRLTLQCSGNLFGVAHLLFQFSILPSLTSEV